MFTKEELNFLLVATDRMPVASTQEARNKAIMTMKIADLVDAEAAPEEEAASEAE